MAQKKKTTVEPLAARLRTFVIENPMLTGPEIKALWKEQGQKGQLSDQTISTAKRTLKAKFFGDIPEHNGKFSKSGVIRQIIAANPNWSDAQIEEYMNGIGFPMERTSVYQIRLALRKKGGVSDPVPDKSGPRAGKGHRSRGKGYVDPFAQIERGLDSLIARIDAIGDADLADHAREIRRFASAQLLQQEQ